MHTITDEQRAFLNSLDRKKRQKEILRSEYLNEKWYARDVRAVNSTNIPRANCWTFGAPCQDFSVAGRRAGLDGERSSLVREIFRILEELEEEDKPTWIIYENVKGMLSSNRGLDFLSILSEMDRLGYDAEWQIVNSRWYVPQNRERVYLIGHHRGRSRCSVFSIKGNGETNSTRQLIGGAQAHRVYDSSGIACTQNAQAGGVGAKTGLYAFGVDKSSNKLQELQIANCLTTKDRGVSNRRNEATAIAIPVLTPFRKEKRQNGRRRKEAGEDMFTLTTQDQHGIAIKADEEKDVWAVWSEKYNCYLTIRKLTPRESFRLQGWTDNYYERAEFVNSNSQLYKQAGNGVTVNVVRVIGEKIMKTLLKYPGAKNRLAPWIVSHIPPHKVYCEPFLGSAAVFLNKEPAYNEILNDLDDDIYNFFKVVREQPEEFSRLIDATPYSRKEYSNAFNDEPISELEKAHRFAVKCWQGFGCGNTYKTGYRRGIGDTSPNPAKAWSKLPETIQFTAKRLKNAQIEQVDALKLIKDMHGENTFIYIDPPYIKETRKKKNQYNHEMTDEQHVELLRIVKSSDCKIMISAYENELYNTELIGWRKDHKSTTAECSRKRTEVIYMNY